MVLICQARSDREIRGVRVHCPAGILGGAASLAGGDIGDMPGRALVVGRRGSGRGRGFDEGGRRAGLE